MSRDWARLELGDGPTIWAGARPRFLSQVAGPHFEAICRDYAIAADPAVFGGLPGEVGAGVVADPASRTQIEIDVAVLAPAEHGRPRKVLSLGQAKWDRVMDLRHVERLRRARDLLAVKGFDTRDTLLSCYSGAGFHPGLFPPRPAGRPRRRHPPRGPRPALRGLTTAVPCRVRLRLRRRCGHAKIIQTA
jgi:uncharacterized protein